MEIIFLQATNMKKQIPKFLSGCRVAILAQQTPGVLYKAVRENVIQPDALISGRPLFLEGRVGEITQQLASIR
jgi:hypothetical protein